MKAGEVGVHHGAGALAAQVDAVAQGLLHGSGVGRLFLMPATGAGGVNEEGIGEALPLDEVTEYAFRRGRAADVAETDKEDIYFGHGWLLTGMENYDL